MKRAEYLFKLVTSKDMVRGQDGERTFRSYQNGN